MIKKVFFWIGVLFIAVSGGGGCNVFSDIANKTSDAALIDDANNLIDKGLWNDAILKLGTISSGGQQTEQVKLLFATAYAGRGGLDVLNLANTLSGSGNPPTLFLTLLKAFAGATASQYNDQITAEGYVQSIGATAALRTSDENMFMLFLEMAKIGTLLASIADTNGDGAVDAGFTDGCTGTSNAQADQLATAIGNMVDCLGAVSNSIISNAGGGNVTTQCTAIETATGAPVCHMTTTSSVTALAERVMKTLVGETNAGIGLELAADHNVCEVTGTMGACSGALPTNLCP